MGVHRNIKLPKRPREENQICDICNYATYEPSYLKLHIQVVHDKIKDFVCSTCNYATSRPTQLRNHIKAVHEKIRNNMCELCTFTSATSTELKIHKKRMHEPKKDKKPAKGKEAEKACNFCAQNLSHSVCSLEKVKTKPNNC